MESRPSSRCRGLDLWRAAKHQVLKGYEVQQLRKSLAFSLLAGYHTYVFFAAGLSILTLCGNLMLAWFISWFQEVMVAEADLSQVSLGFYLAVLTRCWLLIHLAAELMRCCLWLVEDCWQVQTFQTYRQVLTGEALQTMNQASEELTTAQILAKADWRHRSSWQWYLDLAVQLAIYVSLDLFPLAASAPHFARLELAGGCTALLASACSVAVGHCALLYLAWVASDVAAKLRAWRTPREAEALLEAPEPVDDVDETNGEASGRDDPLAPAHLCALLGGALHLGWVTVLKLVLFVALVAVALQRDVVAENPFWLVAALLLGVAFWHSSFQQLAKRAGGGGCERCHLRFGAESGRPGLEVFVDKVRLWGEKNAGMSAGALSQQYELSAFALLLQAALFGNFRWLVGAVVVLLLVLALLLRRATLTSLGRWCAFWGIVEGLGFVAFASLINAAYSAWAGLGVLLMAALLQFTLARRELRAWRTWRAVTLGMHCSLVVVVALCMWCMQGNSHWSNQTSRATWGAFPFCGLRWPIGAGQELSLIDFADLCALTNLGSSFNASLASQFPGWTLVYERRAGSTQKVGHGFNDWTTFFELADPSNETTVFALRGTQSPLDVLQDLNIFTPVAVTQIAAYLGPDLTSSVTKTVFGLFAGLPTIDKDFFQVLLEHVRAKVAAAPKRRFYLTGHSLGGGLAKLVALEVGQVSVTFASPGLRYTSQMLLSEQSAISQQDVLAAGDRLSTVVVPEHDLVSRVDQQLGAQLGVPCDKNPFACHSLQHILYELHQGC
ncbi:unnamed protein product [Effrenium voratum]|nr:unnamed protein product [Effrenium voratum]